MIANKWYCIAQTSTFDSGCSISVSFDSSAILFTASVKYGLSSINISSCYVKDGYLLSIRLRETESKWFVDIKSNVAIEPTVEVANSSYWVSDSSVAGSGSILAVINNISKEFNTTTGSSGSGESLWSLINTGTEDNPAYTVFPKDFNGQIVHIATYGEIVSGGLKSDGSTGGDSEDGTTGGASTLGELGNVDTNVDETFSVDKIFVKKANSASWSAVNLSEVAGLDTNALAAYLENNNYAQDKDITSAITPITESIDTIEQSITEINNVNTEQGNTLADHESRISTLESYWYFDEQGNLHTNYTIVAEGDVVSGGSPDGEGGEDGEGSGSGSTVVVTPILTEGEHIATIQVDGVPQKIYAPKTTEVDLSGYATEDYVDSAIQNAKDTRVDTLINTTIPALESDIAKRALQSSLDTTNSNVSNLQSAHSTLRSEFDALSAVLNDDVSGKINTWNEVVDFLDEYSGSQDLATILSAMNVDIAKRALQTSLDTTNANLTALTTRVTTAENSITSVSNRVKTFEDVIGIDSSGDVYIKKKSDGTARNFYTYGDIISGGEGDGSSSGSGSGGSTVSWSNSYTSTNGLKIATISIDGVDTSVYTAKNLSAYTNDSEYITSAALSGYATQDWVTAKGYLTSVSWSAVTGKPTFATVATSGKYSDLSGTPTIPTSLKSPYALTFGSKTYDGSAAKTITASDLGALTAHQTIYALTIKNSAGTTQTTYTPNSAAASITLTKAMVGLGNVENTALSTWAGSSKITTLGTITTGVWNGTAITNAYINSVDWSKITSKPTTLSGYGITDSLYFQETTAEYAPARFLSSAMATKAATKYIEWWQSGAGWFNHLSGKYIVNGGTSSQFLKADGSLDSTAYIHSGNIGSYNAGSATKLQTARTIWGQSFDGTGNVDGNMNIEGSITMSKGIVSGGATSGAYLGPAAAGLGSGYTGALIYAYGANPIYFYTNITSRMIINSSGNVGIGTTSPSYKLHVAGVIYTSSNLLAAGEVTSGSDARYKSILSHAEIDIKTIANAPIINFKWTDREDDKVHLGSTAQYWYGTAFKHGVIPTDDEKLWTMGYGQIALASVVSVAKKVVNHEERVKILEKRVNELENELEQYRRA